MQIWARCIFVAAAALLLTGCLWGPGKFTSDLTLKKDGSFVLDYKGEIVLQLPPDESTEPWTDAKAKCEEDGKSRPCSKAEIADQRRDYEKKLDDSRQMAKAFGLPGFDDASNRAFGAKLSKYAGWRSVTYRGNGIYDVDYHFEGRATQDFIFPAIPDDNLLIPFIALRRRADGSVLVSAPAFTGGSGPLGAQAGEAAAASAQGGPPPSRAEGRFTIRTDGEILTNNSEDGPSADAVGRSLHWDVDSASKKIPEALIRLQ